MSDENAREVYKALRTAQEKYTYFLLAAAGAAIGLAVNQTHDTSLAWSQVPLGASVVCWALSFFFGCQHARYVSSTLYANSELIRIQSGKHPDIGSDPQHIDAASAGVREAIEKNNARASRFARWQFTFLMIGAFLYVLWHVFEMYLRTVR